MSSSKVETRGIADDKGIVVDSFRFNAEDNASFLLLFVRLLTLRHRKIKNKKLPQRVKTDK